MKLNLILLLSLTWLTCSKCAPFSEDEIQDMIDSQVNDLLNMADQENVEQEVHIQKRAQETQESPVLDSTNRDPLPPVLISDISSRDELCKEEKYAHLRICRNNYKPPKQRCDLDLLKITDDLVNTQKENIEKEKQKEQLAAETQSLALETSQLSSTGLDPCAGGLYYYTVYEAIDYMNGNIVELVHDPANFLYHVFLLRACQSNGSPLPGVLTCKAQPFIYQARVWLSPFTDDQATRFITILGSCHLVYI